MAFGKRKTVAAMFVGPGLEVYEGMIVGVSPKSEDIVVNVCKKKHVTNTRAAGVRRSAQVDPAKHPQLGAVSGIYQGRRAGRGYTQEHPYAQKDPR